MGQRITNLILSACSVKRTIGDKISLGKDHVLDGIDQIKSVTDEDIDAYQAECKVKKEARIEARRARIAARKERLASKKS